MNQTLVEKIETASKVAQQLIDEAEVKLQDAIGKERWGRASELEDYLSGMKQIQIVFEQAISKSLLP